MDTIIIKAVDPKGAAAILGVCRNTVYTLLRTGQLEYFRVGSTYRIDIAALERFKAAAGAGKGDQQ